MICRWQFLNKPELICLLTVKWFQVLLCNTNNSIYYSFVCSQWNGFKYRKWSDISIQSIDRTQTCTTTLGQSGPGSNDNERLLHIPQNSRTGASLLDCLISYSGH